MPASISTSWSNPIPVTRLPLNAGPQLAERLRVLVDDGDRVALVLQDVGERRADPPATHDDDVHGRPSSDYGAQPRYSPGNGDTTRRPGIPRGTTRQGSSVESAITAGGARRRSGPGRAAGPGGRRGRARRLVRGQGAGRAGRVRPARAARRAGPRPGHRRSPPGSPGPRRSRSCSAVTGPGRAAVPARAARRLRWLRLAARQPGRAARAQGRGDPPAAAADRRAGPRGHGRAAARRRRAAWAGGPGSGSRSARTAPPGCAGTAHTRSSRSATARSRIPLVHQAGVTGQRWQQVSSLEVAVSPGSGERAVTVTPAPAGAAGRPARGG